MSSASPSLVHRQRTKYQRSRAVKSRVRSGCVTCKIRHVKCDEKKPVCDRCANAGYECDGYCYNTLPRNPPSNPFLPSSTNNKNLRVPIPRVKSLSNTELIVQPSPGLRFESAIEHRYFTVFQESAASQLSGYYPSSVWDRVVLQACHEEQWARNVVVAIGALHQALNTSPILTDQSRGPAEGEREKKSHYIFALQQYGAALAQLRNISVQEPQSESQLRHALISALLTTCFETYIGDRDKSITQAKAGIDLLIKWTKQKEPADDSVDDWSLIRRAAARSVYLDKDLLCAFQRLDYQLVLCKGIEPERYAPQAYPSTLRPFDSIHDACHFWDLIVRRLMHYHDVENVTEQHNPKGYDDEPARISGTMGKVYPMHMLVEQHNFKMATEQFFRYFDPIFQSSRRKPETKEYLLANLIMIRALTCRSAISRGPSDSEMYSDAFLRDFMLIVDLAHDLIENSKKTLRKAIFNFEITLGLSLFQVANVCREPKLRRAAIDLLLQYPQREAWFDTLIAAKVATWIVNKEEEGMVNGFVPDTARLRLLKHQVGPQKQSAQIYCSKLIWKDGMEAREALLPVTITL